MERQYPSQPREIRKHLFKLLYRALQQDPISRDFLANCPLKTEEDKKNVDKFMTQLVQKYTFYLQQIEKRYIAHGKKNYFLGDYFSLADIYLTVMCKSFCKVMKDKCPTKTAAPAIFELINRIQDNELKTFFDKHFVKAGSC